MQKQKNNLWTKVEIEPVERKSYCCDFQMKRFLNTIEVLCIWELAWSHTDHKFTKGELKTFLHHSKVLWKRLRKSLQSKIFVLIDKEPWKSNDEKKLTMLGKMNRFTALWWKCYQHRRIKVRPGLILEVHGQPPLRGTWMCHNKLKLHPRFKVP